MNYKLIFFSLVTFFWFSAPIHKVNAQDSTQTLKQPVISFSGVVDAFYSYDFNQPLTSFRQPFLYNHNRHNEINLNLGLLRASIEHPRYRANLGLMAGTYAEDNYAEEQDLLKHVFEANAGIALKKNLWLDAGIFASHIGFESAINSYNWTLTRSLLAENSPYFLSGAKITYTPAEQWEFVILVTNGWQRIQRIAGNSKLSLGSKLTYSQDRFILNWSTFVGTDDPDISQRMRYFNNVYGQFELTDKLGLILGYDVGLQQRTAESTNYHIWYSPVLITRYQFNNTWATAFRMEYYGDPYGVIIPPLNLQPFKTSGFSANVDYIVNSNAMWRLEGRWFQSPNEIFYTENGFSRNNFFITSSITVNIGG